MLSLSKQPEVLVEAPGVLLEKRLAPNNSLGFRGQVFT